MIFNSFEELIESTGQTCSATLDWLIAGYADAVNGLLITDDTVHFYIFVIPL